MRMPRALRYLLGIILCLLGASGIAAFGYWQVLLSGISPDGQITGYSWIMLRIMIIALLAPGICLIFYDTFKRWLAVCDGLIQQAPEHRFLLYGLVVSAIARTAWVLVVPLRLYADWLTYDQLAWHMAQAGELGTEHGLTTYRPPGYPFMLSLLYRVFGHEPQLGIAANVLLGIAIVYLTYRLTKRIWGESVARWALVFLCVFPSQILFINFICSEPLFTVLLLIGLLILVERPASSVALAASGVVFGLAALVRSIAMLVPIVLVPFIWRNSRTRVSASIGTVAIITGLLVATVPWVIRNYQINGRATISTTGGMVFYIGNNPHASFGFNKPDPRLFRTGDASEEARNDSLGYSLGLHYIRSEPWRFLMRGAMKVAFMMLSDTEGWAFQLARSGNAGRLDTHVWFGATVQSFYYVFLLVALRGIWSFARQSERRLGGILLITLIGYWLAAHFVFFGEGRYHYPIIPLLAGFAALGASYLTTRTDAHTATVHASFSQTG